MHPMRREIIDEDKTCILYLLEEFKTQAPEIPIEVVGQLIGGILNRAEKAVGYPKSSPVVPEPQFNRADLTTPQTNLPEAPRKLTLEPPVAFDTAAHKWVACPRCGSKKIIHDGKKGTYAACFGCGVFLNVGKNGEPLEPTEMKKQ